MSTKLWRLARAMTVVSGGPVSMAVGGAVAPVAWARGWPDRATGGWKRGLWAVTTLGTVAPWAYGFVVRPWFKSWGSTPEERRRRYPGDSVRRFRGLARPPAESQAHPLSHSHQQPLGSGHARAEVPEGKPAHDPCWKCGAQWHQRSPAVNSLLPR